MTPEVIQAGEPEYANEALTLMQQANGLTIINQQSYDAAKEFVQGVKELQAKAESHHRPVINLAHKTWKASLAALAAINDPLEKAEKAVKDKIGHFLTEQERIKREAEAREAAERQRQQLEQIRLETEARLQAEAEAAAINDAALRRAEEKQEADARLAEAQGATPDEVRAILETPLNVAMVEPASISVEPARYVPPPRMPPGVERGKGLSTRELWTGEVTDMKALCAAIGRGEASPNLVQPNVAAINGLARVERNGLKIPGLRAVSSTSVAVGGR